MAKQTIEIETGLSDADRKLLNAISTKLDSLLGGKAPAGKGKPAPKVEEEDDFAADSTGGESDDGETDGEEESTEEEDDFGTEDETPTVTRAEVNASLAAFAKACDSKSKAFKLLEAIGKVKVLSELSEDKFAAVKERADKETAKAIAAAKKGKK